MKKIQIPLVDSILAISTSFFAILFELLGVGIFIPLITLIQNKEKIYHFHGYSFSFKDQPIEKLFIIVVFTVAISFMIKTFFVLLNSVVLSKYWSKINQKITTELFKKTIELDYLNFVDNSNSTHQNNIVLETEKFTEIIKATIVIIVELIMLIGLVTMILVYDPLPFLVISFFFSIGTFIFFILFKTRLTIWGTGRQKYQDELHGAVKNGLISYLSINVNGGKSFFLNKVYETISKRNYFMRREKIFQHIPRIFVEFVGITTLMGNALILYYFFSFSINEVMSFSILLLVSFTRILPSINRIIASFNEISYYHVVSPVIDSYFISKPQKDLDIDFNQNIILKNISVDIEQTNIIKNLSLKINKGETIGVFGKSGSGKSTLAKTIMCLLKPDMGSIYFDEKKVDDISDNSRRKIFGYVEQNVRIFKGTLYENITFLSEENKYSDKFFEEVIDLSQLADFYKQKESDILQEDGLNLSGGQIQRIGLARALYTNPKILVLDEFTSSLDSLTKKNIYETILQIKTKSNLTIIFISHDDEVKLICDEIINLFPS